MHVVFEESGTFKTAEILSESDTSLQVSLDSGRRIKIKANQVALRFQAPAPADLWEHSTFQFLLVQPADVLIQSIGA